MLVSLGFQFCKVGIVFLEALLEEIFEVSGDYNLIWVFSLKACGFSENAVVDVVFLCLFSEAFDFATAPGFETTYFVEAVAKT